MEARESRSIYGHILRGSLWTILMRWVMRGIGLVSVLILARLLTPADFGIIAMGTVTVRLLQTFSDLGVTMLLIRERHVTRRLCDSAWTVGVMQGALVATILFVGAPLVGAYFREPRLVNVIRVLALTAVVEACENVGMVLVRKEMDFAKDFRFNMYKRVAQFVATMAFGVAWRNYWALAIGQLSGAIIATVVSYRMHPYRPRPSLAEAGRYLRFGASVMPFSVARFLREKFDVTVLGRIASPATLGGYTVAGDLGSLPTSEIIAPISRALFPNYAQLAHEPAQLARVFLNVLGVVAVLCIPAGAAMSVFSTDIVAVLLGAKWWEVPPLMQWLAIGASARTLNIMLTGSILIVSGHERRSALAGWLDLAVYIPTVLLAASWGGVSALAIAVTVASLALVPVMSWMLMRSLPIGAWDLVGTFWRPVMATGIMVGVVLALPLHVVGSPLARLAIGVTVASLSYVVSVLALWQASGRPAGVERLVVDALSQRLSG